MMHHDLATAAAAAAAAAKSEREYSIRFWRCCLFAFSPSLSF
jgi:hypothetical protein